MIVRRQLTLWSGSFVLGRMMVIWLLKGVLLAHGRRRTSSERNIDIKIHVADETDDAKEDIMRSLSFAKPRAIR